MTTDDLMREIREQTAMLKASGRNAAQLRLARQYLPSLYCATAFRPSTWGGPEIAVRQSPDFVGWIYDLSVTTQDAHANEVRVIPYCWEGYGQGMVRPR